MTGPSIAAAGMAALVMRATLILCVALVLAWLARRGSARTLHLLWTTTFALLLALPALSLLGPSWAVPILPARDAVAESPRFEAFADEAPAGGPAGELVDSPAGSGSRLSGSREPTSREARPTPSPASSERTSDPLTPAAVAFLIWALGCGATLTSLAVGVFRFRRLVRGGASVRDPAWLRQRDATQRRMGLRGKVRVRLSADAATPMTGGLWRPAILLPSAAERWTPGRRAVVLAHELIHIQRRDALRQLMGRAVVALYWFHPLSWLASRLATVASEQSCDEEVLALGARPSEYARHLFSLASEMTLRPVPLALSMAQQSQLESRIMSILRSSRPSFSAIRTIAALAAISVMGVLAACANPVPRDRAAQPLPQVEIPEPGDQPTVGPTADGSLRDRLPPRPPIPEANSLRAEEDSGIGVSLRDVPPPDSPVPDAAPPATRISTLLTQLASVPDPPPATPEVSEDAGPQELECNPGNSIVVVRRSGEWTLQQRVGGMRLCMRNRGNVEMVYDGTAVESMDDDSWLVLESQAERLHRLVITPGPSGLAHDWSIDGRSQAFDAEAREWRDLMLTVMSGYREVQEVRGEEASLRGEIASHRGHVASLRGEVASHRGHVASLRGEIASHRGHVASLRGEIASHRGHVASLRGHVASEMGRAAHRHATATAAVALHEAHEAATQAWEAVDMGEALEAATEALEAVDMGEALEAATAALESVDMEEALEAATEALETVEVQEAFRTLADLSEALEAAADDRTTLAEDLQQIEHDLDARRAELEAEIEAYDLDGTVREIEAQIEEYDLDGKVREIETVIEEYDLDGKVREIETLIEQYDVEGKTREIEAQIEVLDGDRLADEMERSIQDDIAALRRLIG